MSISSCGKDSGQQTGRNEAGRRAIVPVEALVIQPQLLRDRIIVTGTVLANEEVELRSETSGRVTGVFFEEGKRVKQGQLLVKINDRELKAQLKQKEVEEKQALDEERRSQKLFQINGISQEDYDKVLNTLHMIQAGKEAIESRLAQTEIIAPFDGIVGLRHVSQGGYVTPAVLVATMQDVDPMKVEFSVPEKYAGQINKGTKILVRVGDSPGMHQGLVYAVESKIDLGTRTIKARAQISNPEGNLIPGSLANIEITLAEFPDAIVIPTEAIIPELNGEMVYVFKGGKANSVSVKTGIRTENSIQITGGLAVNDTLIVSGLLQLADGKEVQIKALKTN